MKSESEPQSKIRSTLIKIVLIVPLVMLPRVSSLQQFVDVRGYYGLLGSWIEHRVWEWRLLFVIKGIFN